MGVLEFEIDEGYRSALFIYITCLKGEVLASSGLENEVC